MTKTHHDRHTDADATQGSFSAGDRVRWHNPPLMEGTVLKHNGSTCKVQWDTGEVRRDDPDKLRLVKPQAEVGLDADATQGGARFTPGPWTTKPLPRDRQQWSIDAVRGDPTLGHQRWDGLAVYGCDDMPEEGAAVAAANARLIAAAPDLFAALQAVLRVADRKTVEFDQARAALALATRREPSDAGRVQDGETA